MPQESLRGVIRGAVFRERNTKDGRNRNAANRKRVKVLAIYRLRFGEDEFLDAVSVNRLQPLERRKWLSRGYAIWRQRLTLNSTRTPDGAGQ